MTGWRITKEDSADLGFAMAALMARAVTLAEFRHWVDRVITDLPAEALPAWFLDLSTLADDGRVILTLHETIGFAPYDPMLERRGPAAALDGIAALRGRPAPRDHDPWVAPEKARAPVERHPEVAARFHAVFPFIDLPGT